VQSPLGPKVYPEFFAWRRRRRMEEEKERRVRGGGVYLESYMREARFLTKEKRVI
jgi:hypothetical protein